MPSCALAFITLSSDVVVLVYDVWPSMVTHTQNSCSAFNPSKVHTHSSEHTHTVNTHPEQWAFMLRHPGSSWGFGALLKGTSVVVLKEERERCTFTPLTYNPYQYTHVYVYINGYPIPGGGLNFSSHQPLCEASKPLQIICFKSVIWCV